LREIDGDKHWPGQLLGTNRDITLESPCTNPMRYPNNIMYAHASDEGHRVMMRGEGGNRHDGHRIYYIDLIQKGLFRQLLKDLSVDNMSLLAILMYGGELYFSEKIGESGRGQLGVNRGFWLNQDDDSNSDGAPSESRMKMPEEISRRRTFAAYAGRLNDFKLAIERREALRRGIELRFPLRDSRIIEFVFSLPVRERFRLGINKALFRRTVKDILPDSVRLNREKPSFDPALRYGLFKNERRVRNMLTRESLLAGENLIDPIGMEQLVDETFRGEGYHESEVWRCYHAERWLRLLSNQSECHHIFG
jgi:hypothetical protein